MEENFIQLKSRVLDRKLRKPSIMANKKLNFGRVEEKRAVFSLLSIR